MTAPAGADASDPVLRELRDEVRRLAGRWRAENRYQPRSDAWVRSVDREFSKELAARGLIGITWPRRFGGRAGSNLMRLAVTEELLRAGAPVAGHWIADRQIGPAVLRHGSPELQAEILPGIVSADYLFCLGMSEPQAGSDLAAVRTRATRTAGGWRVTGRKVWTTIAHHATHAYLLARTGDGARKHDGLSEFIVDMSSPGVCVSPIVDMSGEHHFNEVVFDDVFVPEHRLLGEEGHGWRQVVEQLSFERGGPERVLSTYPLLLSILSRVDDRGGGVSEIGRLTARLAVLRQMCRDVALAMDAGHAPIQESAILKYLGTAFERDVIEVGRTLLPAADAAVDADLAQALLASPGFSIRGGAADVLLTLIARQEAAR